MNLIHLICLVLSVQTVAHMKVIKFQGAPKAVSRPAPGPLKPVANRDLTPSPDVPLAILKRKLMYTNDIMVTRGLLKEIEIHYKVKRIGYKPKPSFLFIDL